MTDKLENLAYNVRPEYQKQRLTFLYGQVMACVPVYRRDEYLLNHANNARKAGEDLEKDAFAYMRQKDYGNMNDAANDALSYFNLEKMLKDQIIEIK